MQLFTLVTPRRTKRGRNEKASVITRDCYAEGGGKEGEGPKQKEKKDKENDKDHKGKGKKKEKETAAVAKDNDKDDKKEEEAWMAMVMEDEWALDETNDPNNDSEDHVLDLPHLFDDLDGTLDVPEEVIDVDQEVIAVPENVIKIDLEMAYLAGTSDTRSAEVDLYDSGTSRHMSGFFHRFINYSKVEPIPIITADKRTFQAIGKGDIYVYLPNGDKPNSRILLKDVLYAPRMGITLVSISRIAKAGSTVVFTGSVCRIYSRDRDVIGEIRVKGGLYRVLTSGSKATAYTTHVDEEVLSLDELHRHLGHVSHDRAKMLVNKGLVEGVRLEGNLERVVCESCEWAKGSRKQVSKVREDERRTAVGDEIHSDLWGKAEVESINHKSYYISFTDDYSRYTNIYFLHGKDDALDRKSVV